MSSPTVGTQINDTSNVPAETHPLSSPHFPLAGQRPRIRPDLPPPTHHADHYVLSRRHNLHCGRVSRVVHLHLRRFLGLLV
jgi:hypothetical protein